MTCIIGFVDNDKTVYIGGDSAGVSGLDVTPRDDEKVFRNGEMIFGFTSSFRMGQLLRFWLKLPYHKPEVSNYEYMVTVFVDAVRECFEEKGYMTIENSEEKGGTFFVGYRGELYTIFSDFQVARSIEGYRSIGCGYAYATGVMDALKDSAHLTSEQKIIEALRSAAKNSGGVCEPFRIVKLESERV